MRIVLPILLALLCVSCADPIAAGPYPQGGTIAGHQFYWNKKFATAVWGSNEPPISTAWARTRDDKVEISPQLAERLSKP